MMRRILAMVMLAGIAYTSTPRLACEELQNITVNVVPFCGTNGFNALGPMAVIVHIYNRSADKLSIIEKFSDGDGIDIKVNGVEGEPISTTTVHHTANHRLVTVKPNSEFNYPLYLTNIYKFSAPGTAQIAWNAKIHVIVNDSAAVVASTGNFPVAIRAEDKDELNRELSRLLDFSMNIEDPVTKMGQIEGICSVRDPSVIPYLQRLLNVRDGEYRSLETLIEVWKDELSAEKVVDNFIETTSDADKLRFVIALFHEKHKLLADPQLLRLIKSKDDAIRFCGILYIHGILDSLHLTDSIPPLSRDSNVGIIAQCDEILKVFSEVLSRNESKTFKKQEAAKASANGF